MLWVLQVLQVLQVRGIFLSSEAQALKHPEHLKHPKHPKHPEHLEHLEHPEHPEHPEHLKHRVSSWYHSPVQLRLPWSAPAPAAPRARAVIVDGRSLPVVIARHRWARRYVARVTASGEVRLTVPRGASIAAGLAFVEREAAWVASEWRRVQQRAQWDHGTEIRYRGEQLTLVRDGAMIVAGEVRLRCGLDEDPRTTLEAHWRAEAARELPARCFELAEARGLRPSSVRVRNQRSRWGACSGRGAITLNWRLLQMPPDVADYVMLHELAHLRQPNHSRRFWREVESLCPGWRAAERWLKAFGRDLL